MEMSYLVKAWRNIKNHTDGDEKTLRKKQLQFL